MPSVGTSTELVTSSPNGYPHVGRGRHRDVVVSSSAERHSAQQSARLIQRWYRERRVTRNSIRVLGFLVFVSDATLDGALPSDTREKLQRPNSAGKDTASTHGSLSAVVLECLCELACAYEEELAAVNLERRIVLDELIRTSDVLRHASDAARAKLSLTHPQLRRLALLPSEARAALVDGFVAVLGERLEQESGTRAASFPSQERLCETTHVLRSTFGAPLAEWIACEGVHSVACQRTVSERPSGLLSWAMSCLQLVYEEPPADLPPASTTGGVALDGDSSLSNIADVPPLNHVSGTACSEQLSKTISADACKDAEVPNTGEVDRRPHPLHSPAAGEGDGTNSDADDEDDLNERYYTQRQHQDEALEAKLREVLGLAERPTLLDDAPTEASQPDALSPTRASSLAKEPSAEVLPPPGSLDEVRVPFLGVDPRKAPASRHHPQCAVCELDGVPFSSEVAEVDAATAEREELLWPCGGCRALVHWSCSCTAILRLEHGGAAEVYCSTSCQKRGSSTKRSA